MKFYSRKLIKPGDLNANNTLFGGALLKWIDEEAGIYAMSKLKTQKVVTRFISEIEFMASAQQGDVIEIGLAFMSLGTSSISFQCVVRNVFSKKVILNIDKIVFVQVDENGRPEAHQKTIEDLKNENSYK